MDRTAIVACPIRREPPPGFVIRYYTRNAKSGALDHGKPPRRATRCCRPRDIARGDPGGVGARSAGTLPGVGENSAPDAGSADADERKQQEKVRLIGGTVLAPLFSPRAASCPKHRVLVRREKLAHAPSS